MDTFVNAMKTIYGFPKICANTCVNRMMSHCGAEDITVDEVTLLLIIVGAFKF